MPLDKTKGEEIEGLGSAYVVAPLSKWIDTPLIEMAAQHAAEAYIKAGAMVPISFNEEDILIQEYYRDAKIAVVFQRRVRGEEMLYPYVFDLPHDLIAELVASGRWKSPTQN